MELHGPETQAHSFQITLNMSIIYVIAGFNSSNFPSLETR